MGKIEIEDINHDIFKFFHHKLLLFLRLFI
jgi:hypothetical protein